MPQERVLGFDFAESGGCELLESRRMLAGTVSAFVRSGQLILNGDRAANDLQLTVESSDTLLIEGRNDTTLRFGRERSSELRLELPSSLQLRMRDGSDTVRLQGLDGTQLAGRIEANLAGGNDTFEVDELDVLGGIDVFGGRGSDAIRMQGVSATNIRLRTGLDADNLALSDLQFSTLTIQGQNGQDRLALDDGIEGTRTLIDLGRHDDSLIIGMDAATESVISSGGVWGLGRGDDSVVIVNTQLDGNPTIAADRGEDSLQIDRALPSASGFESVCLTVDGECIETLNLTADPDVNTAIIESALDDEGEALIPAGIWPVRSISIGSDSTLMGLGVGVSQLKLFVQSPTRYEDQHVVATAIPDALNAFSTNITIRNLTLDGNQAGNDWSQVYNDGNAHGLYVRAASDSYFYDLEIKNAYTDGIYVSTVLGQNNNSKHIDFEDVYIHDTGRQGVSVVGGEQLTFDDFVVERVGQESWGKSPRSAIDLEPEFGVQRLVRDIEITNWTIRDVGQGILVSGGHSSEQAENITIRNIDIVGMNGPQILAVREVENLVVENFTARSLHPSNGGGLGVYSDNTTGTLTNVSIFGVANTNFAVRVRGTSNIRFENLHVQGVVRGIVQIGSEANEAPDATEVEFDGFTFLGAASSSTGLPLIRVNSSESVTFRDGTISNVGNATFVAQLITDAFFFDNIFASGSGGIFDPSRLGAILGSGNNWDI